MSNSVNSNWKEYGGYIDIPAYTYGGDLMLPEYGFGSWIKENGAGLLQSAAPLATMIPVVGPIAGPVLGVAGSVIGGIQENNKAQDAADEQQAMLDEQAGAQKKLVEAEANKQKLSNFLDKNKQIQYASSIQAAMGGNMEGRLLDSNVGDPIINEYSNKANKHTEGVGGVPIDNRGNPSKVSNNSTVGLTEGGEVTWNGYVFSDQLKYKK